MQTQIQIQIQETKVILSTGHKASWRQSHEVRAFITIFAAIFLGGVEAAWALPVGFGTSCTISGRSSAELGNPGVLSSDVHTFSGACGSNQTTSTGRVDVPVQTIGGPNLYSFTQNASASAAATASQGSAGAVAASQADSFPQAYVYTTTSNTGGIAENLYRTDARSSATSLWYDQITVGGTPNANGYVVLEFTLDLHGSTSVFPADGASASIAARFFLDDGYRYSSYQLLGLAEPGTVSQTIGFRPGQQVQLYGDLMATASALAGQKYTSVCNGYLCYERASGYFPSSSAVADAFNTAGFHIDVLTPGGLYSSLSGASYLTAVPAPAAVWLLGSGLLGLAWRGARKNRFDQPV